MPRKADYDAYKISETGNWNVAQDYVKLKIMKYLYLVDEFEIVCTFGYSDILEELSVQVETDQKRIVAFKRLVKYLLMLISNTEFAIKNHKDKETLKKCKEKLNEIKKVIPALYSTQSNSIKKIRRIKINEERFNKILEEVIEIKSDINNPLNNANLIFTPSEEFDPKAYKEKIMEDATNIG